MATIPGLLLACAILIGIGSTAHAQILQSGTRFLVAFPDTVRNLPARIAGGSAEPAFTELAWLIVYTDSATQVSVRAEGFSIDVAVDPARATIIQIPPTARRFSIVNMVPERDAFEVTSEHPVALYCYFATAFGAEAFTPLPVELWGTAYTVPGLPSETVYDDLTYLSGEEGGLREIYAPAEFIVIASADETAVTIESIAHLGDWASYVRKITVVLDAGETYLVQPGAPPPPDPRPGQPRLAFGVSDLARTSVTSTRPIGILAANTRTQGSRWTPGRVWTGNSIKNLAVEWLCPRGMNGTRFAYASPWGVDGSSQQDLVRVYGTATARGSIRGSFLTMPKQIGFNEMHQYSLGTVFGNDGSFWMHTTEKAQATVNGTTAVMESDQIANGGIQSWSAASVDLVPRERWGDYSRFHLPAYPAAMTHAVAIVADPTTELEINGEPVEGWKGFFDAAYKWVRLPLPPGDYTLTSIGGRFTGVAAGRMSGYEAYRPLGVKEKDPSEGLMHASVYHERISVAYAYPLLSGFIDPDSVTIETSSDCTGMSVNVTLAYAGGGSEGDQILVSDTINTRVVITPRRKGQSIVGWDARLSPVDPMMAANAVLRVYSPFGTSTVLPYHYEPSRPEARPVPTEIYDAYIDVARPFVVELRNEGDSLLVVGSARLASGAGGFSITGAVPADVAALETTSIAMSFTGAAYATRYYDTLLLEGPCWSLRVPIAARTRAFVPEPLPEITAIDWRDRWLTTLNACTKSLVVGYDSTLSVANRGTRAFVVVALRLSGADAQYFELDSSEANRSVGYGDVVYPDSLVMQPVRFRPRDERLYRCDVELVTQDGDTVRGILEGRGIESHIAVEPEPLDLGATLFRGPGEIVSTGDALVRALPTRPLTVMGIAVESAAGQIAIDKRGGFVPPDPIDPATWWRLAPGEQRRVPILFAPTDSGVVSGRLLVAGDHATCDDSTIAIVGRTWRAVASVTSPAVIASLACEDARGDATVVNTGPVPLLVAGARVEPTDAPFTLDVTGLPRRLAPGERLSIPIRFSPSDSGAAMALLYVDVRDSSGEYAIEIEPAVLRGEATSHNLRLSIDRGYRLLPGERTFIDIRLEDMPTGRAVRGLAIDMTIDPRLFRALSIDEGDQTDGWALDLRENSETRLSVELTAPAGAVLSGTGTILRVLVEGYLSTTMEGDVPFTVVAIGERCLGTTTMPGHIGIDSICGLSSRWMEAFGVTYALKQVRVAGDGSSAAIDFGIGIESPTTVDIIDARGTIVARLIDATLQGGNHSVLWSAATAPAGVYVARVSAGKWSESRRFVLVGR